MKKKILFIVYTPAIILVLCCILFLLLPYIADHYFLPKIIKKIPLSEKELSLSRITLWKVRGTFSSAENEKSGVVVPKFEINYTPLDLLRGQITSLVIDSASVHLEKKAGKFTLRSIQKKGADGGEEKTVRIPSLPVSVSKIVIKNSILSLNEGDYKTHHLNIDGYLLPYFEKSENGQYSLKNAEGKFFTHGALPGIISVHTEQNSSGHNTSIDIQIPDISKILRFFPSIPPDSSSGSASIRAEFETDGINRIKHFFGFVKFNNLNIAKKGLQLQSGIDGKPLSIHLKGTPQKVELYVSEMLLNLSEVFTFDLNGIYYFDKGLFSGRSKILPDRTDSPVALDFQGISTGAKINMDYQIKGEAFSHGEDLSVGELTAEGSVELSGSSVSGKFIGKIPKIEEKKRNIALIGVSLDLPFNFSTVALGEVTLGSLQIDEIHYKNVNSGKLVASIVVSPDEAKVSTQLTSPLIGDFNLRCSGTADVKRNGSLNCLLPEFAFDSSAVKQAISLPEELNITGKLAAKAHFMFSGNSFSGDAAVNYKGGEVAFGEYTFSDISADFSFPHLPKIQSSPTQLATIGTLNLGKIKMSDAIIQFRVDDSNSIFIEGAQLNWCGGRVETGGLNLFKNMKELDATLYCDRLGYTELLNQLGIGDAEGEGSLNGRLPLYINKEGVKFDDGFLFSTPGNSGIVRFRNTDQLRQGMPAVTQAAYLDYSLKALENFSYNWTKLTFNTEQEQLLLSLQLDGKPAEPLPYGYKQGQIIKTEKGSGLQHPIRLDVNFRLPLNDLFRYGKNIQSIMENM